MSGRRSREADSARAQQAARSPGASSDPGDVTQAGAASEWPRQGELSCFHPPVWVHVTQLDPQDADPERQELGIGTLMDRLVIGERFRVSIQDEAALVTTPVAEITALAEGLVEVTTENRTYRLERLPASLPAEPPVGLITRRLALLRFRGQRPRRAVACGEEGSPGPDSQDETHVVALASAPRPGAGLFRSGARVRITRLRSRNAGLGAERSMGTGRLLEDLEVGASARFAVDDGASVVTSPVRGFQRLGPRALQVVTANTTYRFDVLDPEAD